MAYIDTGDLESTYSTLEDLDNLLNDVNDELIDINSNTNSEIRSNSQNIKVDNSKEQKDAIGDIWKDFEGGIEDIDDSNLNSTTDITFSSNVFEGSNVTSDLSPLNGDEFNSNDCNGFDVNSVTQSETNQVDMKYLREQYSDEYIDSLPIEDEMKELLKKSLNDEDAESFYLIAEVIDTQKQLKNAENEEARIDEEIIKTADPSYKNEWCQNWCKENGFGETGTYSSEEWGKAEKAFDEYKTSLNSASSTAKQNATSLRKSLIEKQEELSLMVYLPYYEAVSSTELEYNSDLFANLPKDEMGLPLVTIPIGFMEGTDNLSSVLYHLQNGGYNDFLSSLIDENGNYILNHEGFLVIKVSSEEYSPLSLIEVVEKTLDCLEENSYDINRDEIINNYGGISGELEVKAYKLLTIQERNVYEKLYHEDPDSAHAYLEAMEVTLNKRAGYENAKKIYEWYITGDSSFERVINMGIVGVGGGVIGWFDNTRAWITGDVTLTENEYTQQFFMQFVSTSFITADIGEINEESLSQLKNFEIGEDTEGNPIYLINDTTYNNLLSRLNKGETLNSIDVLYESKYMDQETYEFMKSMYDSSDFKNFLNQQDGSKFLWGNEEYWGNEVYSAGNSIGNMLPSILIGAALAPAGAAFTIGTTTVTYGQIASNALMFLSSAGSSYKEAKRNGHTESDSRLYGAVSGASEITTGYLLGRIPFVSKVSSVLEDFSASSHHVFINAGLALLGDILGEVNEEVVQIFIGGAAEHFILGEDVTWKDLYSQIPDTIVSTIISTGVTNGVPAVIQLGEYTLKITIEDAEQIASSSDPQKMIADLFFAKFAPGKESQTLNNSNYTQEQIVYIASRLSSDEAILNAADLVTNEEMKAEVISNIINNDIKLEALSKLSTSEAKLTVALTLSDDSAKIKALSMIENIDEQMSLISTISKENQQEAIDIVNSAALETENSEATSEVTNVVDTTSDVSELSENLEQVNEKVTDTSQHEDTQLDSIDDAVEEISQTELEITSDLTEELSNIENVSSEFNTEVEQISIPLEFFNEHKGQGGDIGINQNIISRNSKCKINNLTEIQITNFESYMNELGITNNEEIVLKLKNNDALTSEEFKVFYGYLYDVEFKDSLNIIEDINNYVAVNVQQTSSVYNDLQNKLVTKYGMSNIEAKMLLDLINSKGLGVCGYTTVANAIVWFISQNDLETQFNETFGFSIFNENGTINESELLLDMFMFFNSHFFTETNGNLKLNQSILMSNGMINVDAVDQLLIDLGHITYGYNYQNKETHKNINSLLIEFFESKGMSFKSKNVLYTKGNCLEYDDFVASITDLVNNTIDNGVSLNLEAEHFSLTRNGHTNNYSNGHSMYVIGISNDVDNPGIRVLTFGNEWVIPFSVLYEGISEGHNVSLSTIEISTNNEGQENNEKNTEIESINDDKQTNVRVNAKDDDFITTEFEIIEDAFNSTIKSLQIKYGASEAKAYQSAINALNAILKSDSFNGITRNNNARYNIEELVRNGGKKAIQIFLSNLNNNQKTSQTTNQQSQTSIQSEVIDMRSISSNNDSQISSQEIVSTQSEGIELIAPQTEESSNQDNNQKTSQTTNQQSQTSIQSEVIDMPSISSNNDSQISSQEIVSTQGEGIELIAPQIEESSNQDNNDVSPIDVNIQENVEVLESSISTAEKNSQAIQQSIQVIVKDDGKTYITLPGGEEISSADALRSYAGTGYLEINFLLNSNLTNELNYLNLNRYNVVDYADNERHYINLIIYILGCYQEMLEHGSIGSPFGLNRVDFLNGLNKDSAGFISTSMAKFGSKLDLFRKNEDSREVKVTTTGNVLYINMANYNELNLQEREILIAPFCKTSYNEITKTLTIQSTEYCKSDVTLEQILNERPKLAEALKQWKNLIKTRIEYNKDVYKTTQIEIEIIKLESEIATYKKHLKYYLMNAFVELKERKLGKNISTQYVTINSDTQNSKQNSNLLNEFGSGYILQIGTSTFYLSKSDVKILEDTFGKEWYKDMNEKTIFKINNYLDGSNFASKTRNYVHNEDGSAQITIEINGKKQTINLSQAVVLYLEQWNPNWMYLANETINDMINEAKKINIFINYEINNGIYATDKIRIKNEAGEEIAIDINDKNELYNIYGESIIEGKTIEEIRVILEQEEIKTYERVSFKINGKSVIEYLETDIINYLSNIYGDNWSEKIDFESYDQIYDIAKEINKTETNISDQIKEDITKILMDNRYTDAQKINDFLSSLSQNQIDEIQSEKNDVENARRETYLGPNDDDPVALETQLINHISLMYDEFIQNQTNTNDVNDSSSTEQISFLA